MYIHDYKGFRGTVSAHSWEGAVSQPLGATLVLAMAAWGSFGAVLASVLVRSVFRCLFFVLIISRFNAHVLVCGFSLLEPTWWKQHFGRPCHAKPKVEGGGV